MKKRMLIKCMAVVMAMTMAVGCLTGCDKDVEVNQSVEASQEVKFSEIQMAIFWYIKCILEKREKCEE